MIDILMATYNGERYLKAQLDSILGQSDDGWRLRIRDDGSSDATKQIVQDYQQQYPRKIFIYDGPDRTLGVIGNFSYLMSRSEADYVMFADQDDVWMPSKIEQAKEKMLELETRYGKDKPFLVYTDLVVTNSRLQVLAQSFWRWKRIVPRNQRKLRRVLVQNVVTGSTMLINHSQLTLSTPVPKEAVMHDWWVALVNAGFGYSGYVVGATVMYRQHANNVLGASNGLKLVQFGERRRRLVALVEGCFRQAQAFELLFGEKLTQQNRDIIRRFLVCSDSVSLVRKLNMVRNGFIYSGILRNLAIFLLS